MKKFCEWQIKCKEDTDKTWTCTAHLNEAWAFRCPYKNMKDTEKHPGRCEDAEAVKCPDGCMDVFDEKRYRRTRRETAIHYLFGSRK